MCLDYDRVCIVCELLTRRSATDAEIARDASRWTQRLLPPKYV